MFSENDRISALQLQSLIALMCISMGTMFLPGRLAETSGQSGWIAALGGGILAAIWGVFLAGCSKGCPSFSLLLGRVFGSDLGRCIGLLFGVKLLFEAAWEARLFGEALRQILLPRTPMVATISVLLFLCGVMAAASLESNGRMAEILAGFVFLPLLIVLVAVAATSEYDFIRPKTFSLRDGARGLLPAVLAFRGVQFALFLPQHLAKAQKRKRGITSICLFLGGLFAVFCVLSIAVFGQKGASDRLFSALEVLDRVSNSGIFLTGQDGFWLWFWMAGCSVLIGFCLFYGGRLLFGTDRLQWQMSLFLAVIVGIVALLPRDFYTVYYLYWRYLLLADGVFLVGLPLAIRILRRFKKEGAQK